MRVMRDKQRGAIWGVVFILGSIAVIVLFALRVFPLYNEYVNVTNALTSVSNQPVAKVKTKRDAFLVFVKNAQINGVERFNSANIKDFATIKKSKKSGKRILNVKFQSKNKLFQNLYLMMEVDESIELKSGKDS